MEEFSEQFNDNDSHRSGRAFVIMLLIAFPLCVLFWTGAIYAAIALYRYTIGGC